MKGFIDFIQNLQNGKDPYWLSSAEYVFCLEIRIFSLCTILKERGSKNINLFSCLNHLSMKFQLLRASMMIFTRLKHLDVVFVLLLKFKMPTI